jgi:cytochrome c-type biogenesis protein CcmF
VREFWSGARTRQALSGGSLPTAFVRMIGRNRRRYGGYVVHVGIALVMLGVATSSAFDSPTERTIRPGQTISVGGYDFKYLRATSDASNERLSFGAVMEVTKDGSYVTTLYPSNNRYPVNSTEMGPVGRYFGGESTSEVGLKAGMFRDLWTAVQPDVSVFKDAIRRGNRLPGIERPDVQAIVITALAQSYPKLGGKATFRVIVNPMVTWIWIGALVVLAGALIALWPAPATARSRVSALAAARAAARPGQAEGRA